MVDLRGKKIGLVLSGGGAKGAYQVGMFRALEEFGLAGQITAMSGCSIGAAAAVAYAAKGTEGYREYLYRFMEMAQEGVNLPADEIERMKKEAGEGKLDKERFLSGERFWQYEAKGVNRFFEEIPLDSQIRLNVCCYNIEKECAEYFDLSSMERQDADAAMVASGSLTFVFPYRKIGNYHYLDGGMIPVMCTDDPKPAAKIPVEPMFQEDVDVILVNFLIAADTVDTTNKPEGIDYLELRPSRPLEAYPGAGTLDFSPEKLASHEALGYSDTIAFLKENCIF